MRCQLTSILCAFGVAACAQQPASSPVPGPEISLPDSAPAAIAAQKDGALATVPAPAIDVPAILKIATDLEQSGKLVDAREQLLAILDKSPANLRPQIEEKIGRINIELVLTPRAMPEKYNYTIKQGDTLAGLARANGITEDLLQKSNEIGDPSLIKFGYRLRIFRGIFTVTVNKARNDMVLAMNGRFFKRYRVGTGKFGKTPVGSFQVQERMVEPVWYRPDGKRILFGEKENILGTRWLSLRSTNADDEVKGYGIHGTWDESTIGQSISAGCIRLKNSDVEELYILLPTGTPVVIEE